MENVSESIKNLVVGDYGSLYSFYRSIYKTTYGPSIGFRINGKWHYCDELPKVDLLEFGSEVVDAVSVSSIVEGSDVDVEGGILEGEFRVDEFWELVEVVGEEVNFYWVRDNSEWYEVTKKNSDAKAYLHWENFDERPKWDSGPDDWSKSEQKEIEDAIQSNAEVEEEEVFESKNFRFRTYINETGWY